VSPESHQQDSQSRFCFQRSRQLDKFGNSPASRISRRASSNWIAQLETRDTSKMSPTSAQIIGKPSTSGRCSSFGGCLGYVMDVPLVLGTADENGAIFLKGPVLSQAMEYVGLGEHCRSASSRFELISLRAWWRWGVPTSEFWA
jgi:hypothetical protein